MNFIKVSSFAVTALLIATGAISQDTTVHAPKVMPTQPKSLPTPDVTILACASPPIQAAVTTSCEEVFEDGTVCVVTFITGVVHSGLASTAGPAQSCDFSKRK